MLGKQLPIACGRRLYGLAASWYDVEKHERKGVMMDQQGIPTVLDDDSIREMLQKAKVIAVVGLSDDPARPSYGVARYLQQQGYRIIPVNPEITEVLGETSYPNLASVPDHIDIVNVFRRSSAVSSHVDEVIAKGAMLIWMQLGVRDEVAAQRARSAGIAVVMNRCLAVDHGGLLGRAR